MTYWKADHGFVPEFTLSAPARHLDLAALVVIGIAPGLVLLWLVPIPLVLPALSIVSFFSACAIALFARHGGAEARERGITLWHFAAMFTVIWIGAGMLGGSKPILGLLDHLMLTP
jgi:hypothetical protein